MYKKVTKIKKVTKMYSSPYDEEQDKDVDDDAATEVEVETKIYGDTITMDIPFFVKLLEHVHAKITTSTELQTLAESVVNASKEYPCLTGEWFEKIIV